MPEIARHSSSDEPASRAGQARMAEGHGQGTGDEQQRVQPGHRDIQPTGDVGEVLRVHQPVDRVRQERPAEEQDLGGKEHPHAEPFGPALLFDILEMVLAPLRPATLADIGRLPGLGQVQGSGHSYGPQTTRGVASKLCVIGGLSVGPHSSPVAAHGFGPAFFPKKKERIR